MDESNARERGLKALHFGFDNVFLKCVASQQPM